MEYRTNEKLAARVSLLGYGCMRLPADPEGIIQEEEAKSLLLRALEAGVNYFDTAYGYLSGKSEEFVGRALAGVARERYYLATKLPVWLAHSWDDADRLFDEQRRRLQTDYFDFYLFHALNKERWTEMKTLGLVDWAMEKKREGSIRRLGFSFHDKYEVFEDILTAHSWDFCQIQFNYLDTRFQAGLKGYHLAERLGIPIVVMEPVKGGALANPPEDVAAPLRSAAPKASLASWAIRWAASRPNVLTVLSGMGTQEQLEDNLNQFQPFRPLDGEEEALVERAAEMLRAKVKNGCTGCAYCMPCPAGVNIPKNFEIWNLMAKTDDGRAAWRPWNMVIDESAKADHCVRCGKCLSLCPQKLPIPDDLARARAELDALPASPTGN